MNSDSIDRRDFLKLAGVGLVYISGIPSFAGSRSVKDFAFVQLSDCHWGFEGAKINPDFKGTLPKAIKEVNALSSKPDFVVFTGDLTHTTDDVAVRKKRMKEFKDIISDLDVKTVRFMPGEHDASLDKGDTYKDFFGETHYTFDHKGVHFVAIDNVSDSQGKIGEQQLDWLKQQLAKWSPEDNIVVFTHRPLFDLYPEWDWATKDGAQAIDLLMPYKNVTVFYGHIHQEHHQMTAHIGHHSAKSLMLPMPLAGSLPKRTPIPWDNAAPYKGMGFRSVLSHSRKSLYDISEFPIKPDTVT